MVFSFSAGLRALARPGTWVGRWLGPLGAILTGVLVILAMDQLITSITLNWYLPTVVLTLGAALGLVLALRPRLLERPAHPLAFWVPFGFHGYFLAAGLLSLAILRPPILLIVSLAMLALALVLHRVTAGQWLSKARLNPNQSLPRK